MVEGQIAGLNAAASLGFFQEEYDKLNDNYHKQLSQLRNNEMSKIITRGIKKAAL
jgi:sarcosine oxidase subunit alpha